MKTHYLSFLIIPFLLGAFDLEGASLYQGDENGETIYSLLPAMEEGNWDCYYYFLNYNSDFTAAEKNKWFSPDEDERDWIKGFGPFSNSNDKFFTTGWASEVRPILVRRHFDMDLSMIKDLGETKLILKCSYDENPIVYLNGVKIWETEGWNDNEYLTVTLEGNPADLLTAGDNVLAVSLMSGEGGGHIDLGLYLSLSDSEDNVCFIDSDNPRYQFYNLHGLSMGYDWQNLPAGVYIINGKKIIKNE